MLDESEEILGGVCDDTEIIHEQNDGHEGEVLEGVERCGESCRSWTRLVM